MKWGKLLRRMAALLLASAVLLGLSLTAGNAAAWRRLFPIGQASASDAPRLSGMVRLLVGQSPYLSAGYVLRGGTADVPVQADIPYDPETVPVPDDAVSPEDSESPLEPSEGAIEDILARTFRPTASGKYTSDGGVFIYNRTRQAVDFETLSGVSLSLSGSDSGPQILIVHTHATEAYTQADGDLYQESDPYRTTDDARNVVRVGDEMAAAFAQAGLNVLHDRTLHDYPDYNASYPRCLATVRSYLEAYPSISVVLDVHRDALLSNDGQVYKAVVDTEAEEKTAQVMLVVGTNESGGDHPEWQRNLAFAVALQRRLNEATPSLARPISLRPASYNQQLSPGYLLVEVGTHGNTLQEAVRGARAFAQAVAPLIRASLSEGQ